MSMINNNVILLNDDDLAKNTDLVIDKNCELVLKDLSKDTVLNINVKNDVFLSLKCIIIGDGINLKIRLNLEKNAQIEGYLIDFSKNNSRIDINANLNGLQSCFKFKSATLSALNDKKIFNVDVNHNSPYTSGEIYTYGVCKDKSNLTILGVSDIKENMIKCQTSQNAKIMLIDKDSLGIAKPILKISNDDVKASHGASIGQLNEEHLFYLCSRGLDINQAKQLIVLGYFNQIISHFKNNDFYDEINSLLNERI